MRILLFLQIIIVSIFVCCKNAPKKDFSINSSKLKESLLEANKKHILKESDEIDQYTKLRNWQVVKTQTGLRYYIYQHGFGVLAQSGQYAKINYEVSLLDGTICYSSKKDGVKEFLIDQDYVESGLHEAIKYLHVGDKAKIIIPSHLAHGLLGDENKIPPRSTIIFDIELLSLR